MTSVPPRDLLAMLEGLQGEPRATYPQGSLDYPVTERLVNVLRGKAKPAFGSAEPDTKNYPGLVLTGQQIVSTTRTHVQLYQRFEKLPGFAQYTPGFDATGATIYTLRQRVLATTAPTPITTPAIVAGNNVIAVDSTVEQEGYAGTLIVQYKKLEGPEIVSLEPRPDGKLEKTIRQEVVAGTLPQTPPGENVMRDTIEGVNPAESIRTTSVLTDGDGSPLVDPDDGWTLRTTDPRTHAIKGVTIKVADYGSTFPVVGNEFLDGYITSVEEEKIQGGAPGRVMQIVRWSELPRAFIEKPKMSVTFPGVFKYGEILLPQNYPGKFQPPWPGNGSDQNTYHLTKPRNKQVVGRLVHLFTRGKSRRTPLSFSVYTPGTASRLFGIPDDTVHQALRFYEELSTEYLGQTQYKIEDIPASNPSRYDPFDILTFPMGEERLEGEIYWQRIMQVSEARPVEAFGAFYVGENFTHESPNPLLGQPNPNGETLVVVSSNAGDTNTVTIYGKVLTANFGEQYKFEKVTLNGTTPVHTLKTWLKVQQVHVVGAHAGTVTVRGLGTGFFATLTVSGVPTGNTLTVGLTASPTVYTFCNPARQTILCPLETALNQTDPPTYIDVIFAAVTKRFWFSIGGAGLTPPANPGELHEVAVANGASAIDVATALQASFVTNLPLWVTSNSGTATVSLFAKPLGSATITVTTVAPGFTITATAAGTIEAPNQIRTGYTALGVAATVDDIRGYIMAAVAANGTEGYDYGTGTEANPDVAASDDGGIGTIAFTDLTDPPSSGALAIGESSTQLSTTAWAADDEGPEIATLASGTADAYNDIDFANASLVRAGTGYYDGDDGVQGTGAGEIEKNMVAHVGQILTRGAAIPDTETQFIFAMIAGGSPALVVSFDTATTDTEPAAGSGSWVVGGTVLKKLGKRRLFNKRVTISAGTKWIRMRITNSTGAMRPVSLGIFWDIS